MSIEELVKRFSKGATKGTASKVKRFSKGATKGTASNKRVRIEGNELINFDTTIAIRTEDGVKLNIRKYSRTTSKLQTKIRCYCNVVEEYNGEDAVIYTYW